MTAVTHFFFGGRALDLCGNQGRISRLRPPKARVRKLRERLLPPDPPLLFFPFSLIFFYLADGTGATCPNAVFSPPSHPSAGTSRRGPRPEC